MGFFEDYFINPIVQGTGYNVVNTLVYAAILIAALFGVLRLLQKLRVKTDAKLFYDLLPFVILGGVLRALQDKAAFAGLGEAQYLFVTPLIYVTVFGLAVSALAASRLLKQDVTRKAGVLLLAFFLAVIVFRAAEWGTLAITAGLVAASFGVTFVVVKKFRPRLLSGWNAWPVLAHAIDACSSVTAVFIVGGFTEQHVVPQMLFSVLPYWFFIPIKIGVALLAVHVIDSETKDKKEWNWLLKFTIAVLGLGPGVRNTLSLLMT